MPTKREWLNIALFAIAVYFYHLSDVKQQLGWGLIGLPFLIISIVMYISGLFTHKDDWMKRYKNKKK